jgi:catechol 2,3-dioxygenase-like lactoylglutathione lyase family enzyme
MTGELQLEVAHAVVYVHDVQAMIGFYCDTLGFEVTDRGPFPGQDRDEEIVFLSQCANAHHQLAFITGREEPAASNNVNHVAFKSNGTLDDLKALKDTLAADPRVTEIMPLTHGNAWSVYFRDPEMNGVEVFLDTPWHVAQPMGVPLDLDRPADEIVEWTRQHFADRPEFGPIEGFYAERAQRLARQER